MEYDDDLQIMLLFCLCANKNTIQRKFILKSAKLSVHERIELTRKLRGLNMTQIANQIKVEYHKARRFMLNPDTDYGPIIGAIADVLNVSTKWLITGEGNPEQGVDLLPVCLLTSLSTVSRCEKRKADDEIIKVFVDRDQGPFKFGCLLTLTTTQQPIAVYSTENGQGVIAEVNDNGRVRSFTYQEMNEKLNHIGYIKAVNFL